jgi:hypothetical protein
MLLKSVCRSRQNINPFKHFCVVIAVANYFFKHLKQIKTALETANRAVRKWRNVLAV